MKRLRIVIDNLTVYDAEVAEVQFMENEETVTATGRYKQTPNLMQALAESAARKRDAGEVSQIGSVAARGPRVVRDRDSE